MTPAEVAAILRRFNAWRRGDETTAQPDPREIGEAIDAAVEMIERMELNLRLIANSDLQLARETLEKSK